MKKSNPNEYISLAEASKLCIYSQEYLSLRARQKKLKAVKIGRNWVITQQWLENYVNQVSVQEKKLISEAKTEVKVKEKEIKEKEILKELIGQPINRGLTFIDRFILSDRSSFSAV